MRRRITVVSDAVLDDSDKTLIVPADQLWGVISLYAELITTATVGNRQLDVLVTDDNDLPIAKAVAGAVQAASLTRAYVFSPSALQETAFTGGLMFRAFPQGLVLPEGYKIRVYDSAAIDAAADDLTVRLIVERFSE